MNSPCFQGNDNDRLSDSISTFYPLRQSGKSKTLLVAGEGLEPPISRLTIELSDSLSLARCQLLPTRNIFFI